MQEAREQALEQNAALRSQVEQLGAQLQQARQEGQSISQQLEAREAELIRQVEQLAAQLQQTEARLQGDSAAARALNE